MDVMTAFLNGILFEKVYVSRPDGFVDSDNPNHVYRLKKALYGLKQAPRAWYDLLSSFLLSQEFSKGTIDPTLFIKRDNKDILLVQIYVDDIIFASTTTELCDKFFEIMCSKFEMSMMEYALESLKKYGMKSCNQMDTPMVEKYKLDEDPQGKPVDPTHYHGMVEQVENRVVELYFVRTEYQLADIFTKALCRERIEFLIDKLGMRSFTPETLKELADEAEEYKTINPIAANQIALNNALVPPEARLKIGECNRRIEFFKPQRKATYQVTLDALKLSPCYLTFLITAEVPKIYMHQYWNTINKVQDSTSYRFKLDNKRFRVDAEVFRDILQICPKLPDQPFNVPPSTDEEIISLIYELRYTGNIETLPDLVVYHMHQPKRTFAAVINMCIFRKTTRLDKLSLTQRIYKKSKRVKRPAKKSAAVPTTCVLIKDTLGVSVSKKKAPPKDDEGKGVLNEQQRKIYGIDEGTGTKPESLKNMKKKKNMMMNSMMKRKKIDKEEDDDVTKELYKDVNMNLGNKDADVIDAEQAVHDTHETEGPTQSSSVSSDFASKLLSLENVYPADNEIASLMDTTVRQEEPRSQISSLYTIPVTVILKIMSAITTTIPLPPPSINPRPKQATPTSSEATTLFPALPDF
uniref:Reverse transcriptase Ty1/copia-type domain-containing protein n=1 Tax=Tanacetum cinerariifolium TaxID=118510 RepID=A0A699I559_TANCI|nr:hypothetical protein [Tanacetum cinerariifolium]